MKISGDRNADLFGSGRIQTGRKKTGMIEKKLIKLTDNVRDLTMG